MAKFVVTRREEGAHHSIQVVETTHTAEELLELLVNEVEEFEGDNWTSEGDEGSSATYTVEPLEEGTHEELEVNDIGTVEGFFDDPDYQTHLNRVAKEQTKLDALRVLRNVLVDIGESKRAYSDETYDYWQASLTYSDYLFGVYEEGFENVEEADTIDLSSTVNELLEALVDLRDHETDEEGAEDVRAAAIGPFEEALDEVRAELAKFET